MGLGRAFTVTVAVLILILIMPTAYAVTDLRVPGIPPDLTSAEAMANYNTTSHSNYVEWARKAMIYCRSGSGLWASLDRDYTCYNWLVSVSQLPKNSQPGWTVSGPRDAAKASGLSLQGLSSRLTTGWEPSGPRDVAPVAKLSTSEVMQRLAGNWTASGPTDEAKAYIPSTWGLMRRQAGNWTASGPRDIIGRGRPTGEELVQKLGEASTRDELLYASRVPQKVSGGPTAPMKAGQPYSY